MNENTSVDNVIELDDKREKAFRVFKADHKAAKEAKSKGIDKLITEWNDLYYGKVKATNSSRSKFVMKEVAKQIEWQKPNITEPFLSTSHPIRIVSGKKKYMERYLNNHFTSTFERDDFIEQMTDVKLREGTVWTRSGWKTTYRDEEFIGTMDEILLNSIDPQNIKENEDGTFTAYYRKVDLNHGTARVCKNEHCLPDPGASTHKELRFFIEEREMTLSEMKESGFYDNKKLNKLETQLRETDAGRTDSSLGQDRQDGNEEYGKDNRYQPSDKARQKLKVIEYWGFYDLNGDGIAEPVLASWVDKEDIDLELVDNPYPDQAIPYDNDVYSPRPFSLWGNALAYFIGDNQKVKTGIVRGIVDNMSLANNGQKFIKKGTLDYINFKRMRNGERHIVVNKMDQIEDGSFNNLPVSIFNTLQMITKESEDLSGVSGGSASVTSDMISKNNPNAMQMTMAQQKMAAIVRNSSALISKICRHWLTMAEVFLEDEQIEELFTESEQADYMAFKDSSTAAITIKVGTDVNRMVMLQQLNMLMQQSNVLQEAAPPSTIPELTAEMFELFNKYEQAEEIRNYKPEPNPQQEIMVQMEIMQKQADIENSKIEAQTKMADSQTKQMLAQIKLLEVQAGVSYKQAQGYEKMQKAEAHKVDTAMKPAQVISDIEAQKDKAMQKPANI